MNQQKFFDVLKQNGITPEKAAFLICRLNDFIKLKEEIPQKAEKVSTAENTNTMYFLFEEELFQKVTRLLSSWGFPSNLLGFKYLRDCILYSIENGNVPFTTTLYPDIAKKHNTLSGRVERAIRHSISKVFSQKNTSLIEIMGKTLDVKKGKPTNSEFITFVVDYITNGLL